jgi:predicted nucleic acid-binding protein
MRDLFVDTSAFYALADRADRNHPRARKFLSSLPRTGGRLLTSTDVFDETVTLLRHRLGHGSAVTFGQALMGSKWCRVVDVMAEVRKSAWDVLVRYADQWFSFTDCTSFATMRSMHVEEAFTFDRRDFKAAGFTVCPD